MIIGNISQNPTGQIKTVRPSRIERVSNILDHNEPAQSDTWFIKPKVARDKANRLQQLQLQRQRLKQLRRQRLKQAKWGREDKVRKEALSIEVSNGAVGNR